jgi:hypothetical protein
MNWLQTLLVAAVPAAIAAGALLWQQHRTDEKETARQTAESTERQLDRDAAAAEANAVRAHEMQKLEAERLNALKDSWRQERLEAHVAALSMFKQWHEAAEGAMFVAGFKAKKQAREEGIDLDSVVVQSNERLIQPDRETAESLVSRVEMIASDNAASACRATYKAYQNLLLEYEWGGKWGAVRTSHERFTSNLDQYRQYSRQDIDAR